MKRTTNPRSGALAAAIIAALLTAAPASAAALGATSITCRAAIAKAYSGLLKTADKTIGGCHKSRDKGDLTLTSVNCNNLLGDAAHVDSKGKYGAAVTKAKATMDAACGSLSSTLTSANVGGGKEYYVSCPVACPGVPNPMVTMGQVSTCLGCAAAGITGGITEATLGSPVQGTLDAIEQKCHGAIAKGYAKYLDTAMKEETSCQGTVDLSGLDSLTTCRDIDTKGKVAGAKTKADDGLLAACAAVNLVDLDGCATDTVANLKSCTGAEWATGQDDAFTSTYEAPATICPSTIRTTIYGGCSTAGGSSAGVCSSGFQTGTQLSVGWKGLGHRVDITDNYTLAGDVTCAGTVKGACGECTVQGISYDNPQYSAFSRCEDDPWTPCTHPFANDAVCNGGSGGACKYYLGPPLAVSAAGTPTCTLNILSTDISGTANPDTGESALLTNLRAKIYLGASQARPCPICQNDATPQDGVKSGTCLGGPQDGQGCDVQGFDLTFAPTDATAPTAGSSLDCPPPAGGSVGGNGLAIALPLNTFTALQDNPINTKDAVDPCDGANAGLDCFCGACSGDPTVSCNSDTDCSSLGIGNCGAGNGVDRLPNNCSDLICTPVPGQTDRGQCSTGHAGAGDVDNFCDGLLFANGHGVITCNVDADCDAYSSICAGNNCGTCSTQSYRSCFLDPIKIAGDPDTLDPDHRHPILAGVFCLPPSPNGSVNAATGAPGPGTVQTDSEVELRY